MMFDTSFRWTLLKIVILAFTVVAITDFILVKVLELFIPTDIASIVVRLSIVVFFLVYYVVYPKYSSSRNNKIIEDLTDPEHNSFFKSFGVFILIGTVSTISFANISTGPILFDLAIGACFFILGMGSGRLEVREKGIFTRFGLISWQNIESYEFIILGVVFKQKGWRRFFPTLHKLLPWQRTKLEKYLAELNPYIKS